MTGHRSGNPGTIPAPGWVPGSGPISSDSGFWVQWLLAAPGVRRDFGAAAPGYRCGQDRRRGITDGTLAMTLVLTWQGESILDADPGSVPHPIDSQRTAPFGAAFTRGGALTLSCVAIPRKCATSSSAATSKSTTRTFIASPRGLHPFDSPRCRPELGSDFVGSAPSAPASRYILPR